MSTLCPMVMWVGALQFDLLLGDVHSLKEKRSLVRPLIAELRRRFELSVAEVDHLELHRRAAIGVAAVSPDRAHLVDVLDAVEQLVAYRPEVELLSVRRTLCDPPMIEFQSWLCRSRWPAAYGSPRSTSITWRLGASRADS